MTSQILNVVIVLISLYVALSIACSFLQEQFAALLNMRGEALAEGLGQLVAGDVAMREKLLTHPLVADAPADGSKQSMRSFPSYVDPRNFSLAFWQTVQAAAAAASSPAAKALVDPKDLFGATVATVNAWSPLTLSGQRIRQSAVALIDTAQGDYDRLLAATDAWFNAKMDRVSGWYKRRAQYVMIGIAFALAFGSGIDSIELGRQLFAAPAFTQAMSESISSTVNQAKDQPDGGLQRLTKLMSDAQLTAPLQLSRWSGASTFDIEAFLGLLVTAIAISLGAPFWFDLLKCVVNVRMAGAKPDTAPPPAVSSTNQQPPTQYVVPTISSRMERVGSADAVG